MRWPFVIAIAFVIGDGSGCRDEQVARLEAVRDEICACKTAQCGDDAMKHLPAPPSSDHRAPDQRAQHAARAMMDCLQKLYLARPATGHDAEPAPTAP